MFYLAIYFWFFLCFDEEEIELDFKNCAKLRQFGQHKPRPADRPAYCRQQAVLPALGCAQPQLHQTDAAQFYLFFACRFSTNFVFSSISLFLTKQKKKKVENSSKQHEIKRTKKTVEKRWIKEKMLQSSRHTSHDSMLKNISLAIKLSSKFGC